MEIKAVAKKNPASNGSHWITDKRRLAIYQRDGFACCYCGKGIEQGIRFTLDHLVAASNTKSTNANENLVTACMSCNGARGNRSWRKFAVKVAEYVNHGVTSEQIIRHILATRKRAVDTVSVSEILASRAGFSAALAEAAQSVQK